MAHLVDAPQFIVNFGYTEPVRVCNKCNTVISRCQEFADAVRITSIHMSYTHVVNTCRTHMFIHTSADILATVRLLLRARADMRTLCTCLRARLRPCPHRARAPCCNECSIALPRARRLGP